MRALGCFVALCCLLPAVAAAEPDDYDTTEAAPAASDRPLWREHLDREQLSTLRFISQHPAVQACIAKADAQHPIACYNTRKLVEFAQRYRAHIDRHGAPPAANELQYERSGMALQWCAEQAGITLSNGPGQLRYELSQMAVVPTAAARRRSVAK